VVVAEVTDSSLLSSVRSPQSWRKTADWGLKTEDRSYRRVIVIPPFVADARILGPPLPIVPRSSRRLLINPLTVTG
jgi:hypothetical protein